MGLVNDKIALVTGAGAGIGRATALKFANEGAKVVASDVNIKGGEKNYRNDQKSWRGRHFRQIGYQPVR